jgi:pyruvate,orthophosphate dikinase
VLHFPFTHPHEEVTRSEWIDLLGGKGAGLAMMAGELALPVPPGFTLTTRACRRYLDEGWTAEHEDALREGVSGVEAAMGREIGDAGRPLLLSVRSGAPDSMPGMLDSVLNVGLNDVTQRGLAIQDASFARDCRVRLDDSFGASVGEPLPEDPWLQLRLAVESVFRSAQSPRATAYRRKEGLADDFVTAVNVQAMVFGNRDEASATGVLFSRDPATGEARLYGDVLFRAQGEDVVSGGRETEPLESLEARLPEAWEELKHAVGRLEWRLRDLVEVEFTIEQARLWLLQVRTGKRSPRAALRIAAELAADPDFPLDRRAAVERVVDTLADPPRIVTGIEPETAKPVGRGLAASPGVVSGEVVVDIGAAIRLGTEGRSVILVRPETSPADVEGISLARGLLTSRGGLASHAAVVARGWGIPAVVGLEAIAIDEGGFDLAGRRFDVGDTLSIDGASGAVYAGTVVAREEQTPEVPRLLEWARDLGIEVATRDVSAPTREAGLAAAERAKDGPVSEEAIIQVLSIKGATNREAIGASLGLAPEAVDGPLAAMDSAGLVGPGRPLGVALTDAGNERAAELLAADRAALGDERVGRSLDSFQALDMRMKEAVQDWQLRSVAGELVPNDHSDASWDEHVFARLAEIHQEIEPRLGALAEALPRLSLYSLRLASALAAARDGDGRFVASPRVDSFHGIWFELHEDLIRLAGKTRGEEVAAGRAG